MRPGCHSNWGCHVWTAMGALDLREIVFSVSYELRLLKLFVDPNSVCSL